LVERSTRWTYTMFHELSLGQIEFENELVWHLMRQRSEHVTVGLYDRDTEQDGFGLAILVSRSKRPPFEQVGNIRFTRLERSFPLVLRQVAFDEHAPPHPQGATGAAWVRDNRSTDAGVLTAGHAVPGIRPGVAVPIANGASGVLIRSAYPIIDAAFVGVPGMPAGLAPMPVMRFPAAGQSAIVELRTGPVRRTVVAAVDSLGAVHIRAFRISFYTDAPCSPGDSGALVRSPQDEAMGIYSGSLAAPAAPGGIAGFSQNFEQATYALDVTAYR